MTGNIAVPKHARTVISSTSTLTSSLGGLWASPRVAEAFPDRAGSAQARARVKSRADSFAGKKNWRALTWAAFSLAAFVADALVILMAAWVSGLMYPWLHSGGGVARSMLAIGGVAAAIFVVPQATRGEYAVSNYLAFNRHMMRCAHLWIVSCTCVLAIGFLTKTTGEASRAATLFLFFGGYVALLLERWLLVRFTRSRAAPGGVLSNRIFLVGQELEIAAFRARYEPRMFGMEVVGAFALRGGGSMTTDLALAAATARFLRPDEVFIIVPWSNQKAVDACIDVFRRVPARIHLGPERILTRFAHAHIATGAVPTLGVVRPPLSAPETLLKRALDIVGATMGLILLSPLFALTALLIKLDSPGSVIFRQRRYGFNQEPFRIYKFRTMTTAEDGKHVLQATKDDSRVTRVGRFLRRYNIDELPQLINVLLGDMSLVGPRPHACAHDQRFERTIATYARRHNMKPGITGWAQVNGYRGEINSETDLRHRIEHDLFYIDNYSFWLDLHCIVMTLMSTKAYRNAY